jgi:prostaglandin-endoperoxide synthase 2
MVAVDAFSHALTNPLLSPRVYNEDTFTSEGFASIQTTHTLRDIADRNLPGGTGGRRISMDQPGQVSIA